MGESSISQPCDLCLYLLFSWLISLKKNAYFYVWSNGLTLREKENELEIMIFIDGIVHFIIPINYGYFSHSETNSFLKNQESVMFVLYSFSPQKEQEKVVIDDLTTVCLSVCLSLGRERERRHEQVGSME